MLKSQKPNYLNSVSTEGDGLNLQLLSPFTTCIRSNQWTGICHVQTNNIGMAQEITSTSAPKCFGTTEMEVGRGMKIVYVIVTMRSKERLRREAYI